ncbi:MAG: hypothetical protein DRJ42_24600 [Deltaproteobacteria bacterium]|nr:MAG: hypothetical protein DRJ42_24600 [Deltaproteobacteria bacterium]
MLLGSLLGACDDTPAPLPAEAVFELPRDGSTAGFFDLPWPTDLRRTADGFIDVTEFTNPRGPTSTLGAYIEAASTRLRGYGTNAGVYFRFSVPIDPASLPATAADTLEAGATVFLFDLETGERHPGQVTYHEAETIYWAGNTVSIRPVWGMPLEAGHRYAAVVTGGVTTTDGTAAARSRDFTALIDGGGDAATAQARDTYGPAIDTLVSAGVSRDDLVSLAVFTTQDPTAELITVRDWMVAEYPIPTAPTDTWRWIASEASFTRVEGRYGPSPTFQSGDAPYDTPGSGEIVIRDGVPVVAGEFDARFMLTVPTSPMPADGYLIVLYAHGTGGSYASFANGDLAQFFAEEGYAMMGIDQVLHGDRNPTTNDPELLFFNFLNPLAARDNNRQAALDVVQQARFAATVDLPETILTGPGGASLTFDPARIYVYGHSQGGLNLPLFLAVDDSTQGGFLSGAGGTLSISVIEKTEPIPTSIGVQLFLALPGSSPENALEQEAFDYEHPVLSLIQTWDEAADGVNYGRMIFDRPRTGFAPKSVFMSGGQADPFTSANANASLAASMRMPLLTPVVNGIEANDILGIGAAEAPVTGNVAAGTATAGLLQIADGGHFVAFQDEGLQQRIRGYFASFTGGVPTIPRDGMVITIDAGMTMDAGADAATPTDGGADAAADAGSDASTDASSDAGVPMDAAP